eukprot:Opistho-2@91291
MARSVLVALVLVGLSLGAIATHLGLESNRHGGQPLRSKGAKFVDLSKPTDVDPEVDCGLKVAAWDYARQILPERGVLASVFDGLQLGVTCGMDRPSDVSAASVRADVLGAAKQYYVPNHATAGVSLYVDPVAGKDAIGRGALSSPFKTISFALAQSRGLRPTLADGATIQLVLRGGLYNVPHTIKIGADDSYLDIGAYGDEEPVLSGSCVLGKLAWRKVASPPAKHVGDGAIYVADVSSHNCGQFDTLFVNGRRAVRARYPNGNPETTGLHTNPTGYISQAKSWLPQNTYPAATEIHIDNPSRRNHFPTFAVGIGGSVVQFDPPVSYFATQAPVGGGAGTYGVPGGLEYNVEDLPDRSYAHPEVGIVHAFHYHHWGGWQFRIDSHNETANTFQWTYGGFQEARGEPLGGTEYYIENLLEELDAPGEWYLDYKTNNLYYYPNSTNFQSAVYTASGLETIIRIEGDKKEPVRNVSIHGLTFTQTAPTFMKAYEAPSGGDWSVHRGATLFIEGCEFATVAGNTFNATGGNAVFLSNYNRGAVVARNEFFLLGDSAIVAVGKMQLNDGTNGDQPRGSLIEGNIARDFGVYSKQVCGFVQSLACETTVRNNVFFNGPRAGINFNDGFGGGNLVQGNLMFNLVRETSDHGPFNSWDRVPYLHDLNDDGVATLMPHMSNVTGNFLFNNYNSVWPIDHDDGSMYYYDTKNVLVYGGYKNFLGHHQTVVNNVYIFPDAFYETKLMSRPFCLDSLWGQYGDSGYSNVWANNVCMLSAPQAVAYTISPCDENDTYGVIPFTSSNSFYTPNGTVTIPCGSVDWDINRATEHGYDIGSHVQELPTSGDIVKMVRDFLKIESPQG